MRLLLTGNEAIARGAWEGGVTAAFGYPGTPSTEILENLVKYDGVYCEWSPNVVPLWRILLNSIMKITHFYSHTAQCHLI